MIDLETSLADLDLGLFEKIVSQSTDYDKRSLLAVQSAVRELRPDFKYLEIGSYLGGSIQPYLLDDKCAAICSIDKRPVVQPDSRGFDWKYENNSTERMLENLRAVSPENIGKITTIDGDSRELDPKTLGATFDLCFIDGEHTDAAVISDFEFCRKVLGPSGAIVFHDAQITYNGIAECISRLERDGVAFNAYVLPNIVFVVEIGDFPLHRHQLIAERLVNNHLSYLFSLQNNDNFRRFANRFPFRQLRSVRARLRRGNVST